MRYPSTITFKPTAVLTLLLCALAPGLALSVNVERIPLQNATADCQGALPSFEGAFRKRPTGIANEGDSSAFLTCSMQGDASGANSGNSEARIAFSNPGAVNKQVNCTLVSGLVTAPQYFPKSNVLFAGVTGQAMTWTAAADNGGSDFSRFISFSCEIPAGVEANWTFRRYNENVGQ